MNESDKRLTEAMQSAVAIMEGKADPSTYRVHTVADPDVQAMALSTEANTRRTEQKPSLVEFLRATPLAGVELDIARDRSLGRMVDPIDTDLTSPDKA